MYCTNTMSPAHYTSAVVPPNSRSHFQYTSYPPQLSLIHFKYQCYPESSENKMSSTDQHSQLPATGSSMVIDRSPTHSLFQSVRRPPGLLKCPLCSRRQVEAAFVRSSVKRDSVQFLRTGFQYTRYRTCNQCSARARPNHVHTERDFIHFYGTGYHQE